MGEPENQDSGKKNRAAVYIDGYNLYHPINDMGEPFLKWINLWNLSELCCLPISAKLVKVVYCTAVADHMPEKRDRHNTYIGTQRAAGVTVIKGHHVFDDQNNKYTEKQSDINVALSIIMDGLDDIYDVAFLLSADSDQAATARVFSERLDKKLLIGVAPPGKKVPHKATPYMKAHFALTKEHIEQCVMPQYVNGKTGPIRRPVPYDPPNWWVHPDNRPKKK